MGMVVASLLSARRPQSNHDICVAAGCDVERWMQPTRMIQIWILSKISNCIGVSDDAGGVTVLGSAGVMDKQAVGAIGVGPIIILFSSSSCRDSCR